MSDPFADRPFPRGALAGAAGMIVLTLSLATYSRWSGERAALPAPSATIAQRELWFLDQPTGAVAMVDAQTRANIEVLQPGSNGFLRATLRTFVHERRSRHLGAEAPFHLSASRDGRLTLTDPATGRTIELRAFGATNAAIFARFLRDAPSTSTGHTS